MCALTSGDRSHHFSAVSPESPTGSICLCGVGRPPICRPLPPIRAVPHRILARELQPVEWTEAPSQRVWNYLLREPPPTSLHERKAELRHKAVDWGGGEDFISRLHGVGQQGPRWLARSTTLVNFTRADLFRSFPASRLFTHFLN